MDAGERPATLWSNLRHPRDRLALLYLVVPSTSSNFGGIAAGVRHCPLPAAADVALDSWAPTVS